jgi:choline dehydrogenase-like flavoprotein
MGDFWRGLLKGAIGPADNDSRFLLDVHSRDLPGEKTMRRYHDDEEVDLVVVGAGAGGSVLAQRLARAGWRIVILEAGPFWHPDEDWVSDEAGSHRLYWTQKRIIGGSDPIELGQQTSGRGVGGSMVHYSGYNPRFHPSDFETFSRDQVGADWPISYAELRPHYERLERELPVAGQDWPWGYPHRYPFSPHPVSGAAMQHVRGALKLGITMRVGPVGIVNGTFGNRPHCIYRGYCNEGCKVNAKASPYVTHLPDALSHGVEIRANRMASRVELDETGNACGVTYFAEHGGGALQERRQRAKVVAVAGSAIETARLLLNSRGPFFPKGLCNNNDQVGRYMMVQGGPQVAGRWPDELRMYKAPPPQISSEQFYETDPGRGFARGFSIQTIGGLPISFAGHVLGAGHWGASLREYVRDYNHWANLGALNELLPYADNRVTLADETDPYGIPIARFDYSLSDNDKANIEYSTKVITNILHAADAQDVLLIRRFEHLMGGARMGSDPDTSVVNSDQRTWAVPNLFVADGSVCPTQGSANPSLTIMALASRLAERIVRGDIKSDVAA